MYTIGAGGTFDISPIFNLAVSKAQRLADKNGARATITDRLNSHVTTVYPSKDGWMSNKNYLDNRKWYCPRCRGTKIKFNDFKSHFYVDKVFRRVYCETCKAEWKEVYYFGYYKIIKED